jgi:mannose-6-phosphate isomerase
MKLARRYVEKPWGRTSLPAMFGSPEGQRIGEIWFIGPAGLPLLAKYIFTSERLSIQVHPPEKTECWYVLDAEPGATIGLGLTRDLSSDELRAAAQDGSIEQLVDWRPVRAGDFFLVPPGTIHAIGGGLTLLEFQQNADVTYRLYDYGRPRALHIDDGVAVADPGRFAGIGRHLLPGAEQLLADGPAFTLVHSHGDRLQERRRWIIPLDGQVRSGSDVAAVGECLLLEPGDALAGDGARLLIGAMP